MGSGDIWDDDSEDSGASLRDLAKDGALAPIADAIIRPVEAERDAYREIAVEKEIALREMARRDVDDEATRRTRRGSHLKAVNDD